VTNSGSSGGRGISVGLRACGRAPYRSAVRLALFVSLGLLVLPAGALAQDEDEDGVAPTASGSPDSDARAEFERGAVLFAEGDFAEALAAFEHSYGLSGRPELLYNIAICHDRLRHDREAVENYEAFLSALPETPRRAEVEGRLPALREAVAREDAERAALEAASANAGSGGEDVAASPWLWLGIGAGLLVVAGVAIGVGVATYDPGTEAPMTGTGGLTIFALSY
jgi:tetratricopeptide (TPR) repeat protein